MQDELMKYDPENGKGGPRDMPYPSHAKQYREWHGGVAWLFNPWTGEKRDPLDIGRDPHGLQIVPPGAAEAKAFERMVNPLSDPDYFSKNMERLGLRLMKEEQGSGDSIKAGDTFTFAGHVQSEHIHKPDPDDIFFNDAAIVSLGDRLIDYFNTVKPPATQIDDESVMRHDEYQATRDAVRRAVEDVERRQQQMEISGLPYAQEPKYGIRHGHLFNRATGEPIPTDEPVFILRARDKNAAAAIAEYGMACTNPEHKEAVAKRVQDFLQFGADHPDRVKHPDTTTLEGSRT